MRGVCRRRASVVRRRLGSARARRRPRVRTRARTSGPGPAERLGASHLCGVIVPRARRRRRRPARTYRLNEGPPRRRRDRGLLAAEPRRRGNRRRLVRQRQAPGGFWVQEERCFASGRRHIDSTLGFTIAVAAKTATFIIVTARGCLQRQSQALRGCLPRRLELELSAERSN